MGLTDRDRTEVAVIFGWNLRQMREGAGITRESLARSLDIGVSTLEKYECAGTLPNLCYAVRISDFFGTTVNEMVME